MELISHKEAIREALKNKEFNREYKKNYYYIILARNIYNIRRSQNLTQEEFSKKYKINYLKLVKIESGCGEKITLESLGKILEKLGLYMDIKIKNFNEDLEDYG